MISVELPVSAYTRRMMVFLMDPWIIGGLSPCDTAGRGAVAEKVKPCMDRVM